MPTKQQEVDILDATIKKLTRDSYLGPWLAEIRDGLVADINNDVSPDCSLAFRMPSLARREAADIIERATADAKARVERADERARGIIEGAHDERDRLREDMARRFEELAARARRGGL